MSLAHMRGGSLGIAAGRIRVGLLAARKEKKPIGPSSPSLLAVKPR
jgi:hypothetical protein